MKQELQDALVKDFPLTFRNHRKEGDPNPIAWFGIECGDGWEPIIRRAAERLEPLIKQQLEANTEETDFIPCASQIKEKFGLMRFYFNSGTDEMWEIVTSAEDESLGVCETCGALQAEMRERRRWFFQACDTCYENE